MVKIDFSKVEQNLGDAVHHFLIKKLADGETVDNDRMIFLLGQHIDKPTPQDSVIEALIQLDAEENEEELSQELHPQQHEHEDKIDEIVAQSLVLSIDQEPFTPLSKREEAAIPPLFILRKRILWFVRKRVANIYKLLGTTKEEVIALRKSPHLSEADLLRVQELLKKSTEINQLLNKKLGLESNDTLIAVEKKKHLTKRFNVRDSWLPL